MHIGKVTVISGMVLFLLTGRVFAPQVVAAPASAVNPHGNYLDDTSQCARCHSTHTALAARLLKETSEKLTCYMCHDGTQSNYNVKAGIYWNGQTDLPSPAGGFNTEAPDNYTSVHDIEQGTQAPGGLEAPMYLTCSSCHNPHGYPATNNYRLLQKRPGAAGNPVTVTAAVTGVGSSFAWPEGVSQPADPNFIDPRPAVPSNKAIVSYIAGIDDFCAGCHGDYILYGSENTASNLYSGSIAGQWNYRHRVGVTMVGGSSTGARSGDNYWRSISFPAPGLYTSLPTLGAPTGARIDGLTVNTGSGSLPSGRYHYLVTSINYGGTGGALQESVAGNIYSSPAGASGSITIFWQPVTCAAGYKIYRAVYDGEGSPPLTDFRLLTPEPLWDDGVYSFTDDGSLSPADTPPPSTYNARLMCLTCHYAHGTKATMDELLASQGARLLRLNNRGVCEDCHKK